MQNVLVGFIKTNVSSEIGLGKRAGREGGYSVLVNCHSLFFDRIRLALPIIFHYSICYKRYVDEKDYSLRFRQNDLTHL